MEREITGIDPTQVVPGEQAEDQPDQHRRADHDDREQQGRAGAVHSWARIAPEGVGAEQGAGAEPLGVDLRLGDQAAAGGRRR